MPLGTALVGLAGGLAGIGVALILRLVQHLSFGYSTGGFLAGVDLSPPWRRVAALAAGGLLSGLGWWWLRRHATAEDVSVTRALRESGSRLPLLATTADGALQAIAVGSGASLGREGAPRQIGAALGGWIAARLQLSTTQRRTLLACGAGAGLGAVYDVPLGGALFTCEILLASAAWRDVVPAVATSTIATVLAWPVLSSRPTYEVTGLHLTGALVVWAVPAGAICGVLGVGFSRLMTVARTRAPSGGRSVITIVVTFAVLGGVSVAIPELLGNGKGPTQVALTGSMAIGLAAVLTLLKPIATAACLGAGAIGGLLTPSLATGASFGVLAGHLWTGIWPGTPIGGYAMVGAAAMLAVTQRAPLTAAVLALEFVRTGWNLSLPIVLAVATAALVSWLVARDMVPIALTAARNRRRVPLNPLSGSPERSGTRPEPGRRNVKHQ
jgi:H+/Cl- antiporter ClcA